MKRQLVTLRQAVEQRPWLTERWLRRLVFERRVPFHKIGSRLLFDLADLDALVEQGRVERATTLAAFGDHAGVGFPSGRQTVARAMRSGRR